MDRFWVRGVVLVAGCCVCGQMSAVPFAGETACVTYEQYGAVGDGRTDDRAAVVAAHAAANKAGLPVRATDGKTYFLGKGRDTAIIKTDVDFGTAKFIIDDVDVPVRNSPAFKVVSSRKPFRIKDLKPFKRGDRNLGVTFETDCLVIAENENVRQYIRCGANQNAGFPQKDVLIVRRDGSVDPVSPVVWDFETVTKATAYPIDEKPLTVRGGVFVTIANQGELKYLAHNRGIVVARSNTVISRIRHEITGEKEHGSPYAGFIDIRSCVRVTVKDCVFTGHKTYWMTRDGKTRVPMGSYDLTASEAVDIRFLNCSQTTDLDDGRYWGVFASNYCKALHLDGCAFSRFDAHMGVCGATILNCRLGHQGINAIGFGTLRIENTEVRARRFINLRSDYGSTWRGDVIVKNARFVPVGGRHARLCLIGGKYTGNHDFGYPCHLPEKIVFDGLYIGDAGQGKADKGPFVFEDFNPKNTSPAYTEKFPCRMTEKVVLKDVKTASGRTVALSPNAYMFKTVKTERLP